MSLNISPFTLSVVEGIEVLNKTRNKEGELKGCLKIEGNGLCLWTSRIITLIFR